MTDPWPSEPNSRGVAPARPLRGQLLLVGGAAILVIGGIFLWRIGVHMTPAPPPVRTVAVAAPAKNPQLEELVKATRALNSTQQQAIDQLQVLQDTVASQAAALKASSEQVTELNDKLEALRQSFASAQPAAVDQDAKPAARDVKRPPPRHRHKPRRSSSKRHGSRSRR
jgi:hypothetical protein